MVVTECDEGGHAARNHVTTTRALVFISLCKQLAILTAIKKSCKSSYHFSVFLPTVAEVAQAEGSLARACQAWRTMSAAMKERIAMMREVVSGTRIRPNLIMRHNYMYTTSFNYDA